MERIVILGASGHGRVVADIFERMDGSQVVGFLDQAQKKGDLSAGLPVLGLEEDLPGLIDKHGVTALFVAVGDNWKRRLAVLRLKKLAPGLPFISAIHPAATIADTATIGEGVAIMAGVVVNPHARVSPFAIVNTLASVDHDASVEEFASLSPHSSMGGGSRLGPCSVLGQGAALIHNVSVGEHAVVGAGAAVVRDIPGYCLALGAPAIPVRSRGEGESYL